MLKVAALLGGAVHGRMQAEMLPALERAMKAVLVEKRQALLNVVCDVDANAGGD